MLWLISKPLRPVGWLTNPVLERNIRCHSGLHRNASAPAFGYNMQCFFFFASMLFRWMWKSMQCFFAFQMSRMEPWSRTLSAANHPAVSGSPAPQLACPLNPFHRRLLGNSPTFPPFFWCAQLHNNNKKKRQQATKAWLRNQKNVKISTSR